MVSYECSPSGQLRSCTCHPISFEEGVSVKVQLLGPLQVDTCFGKVVPSARRERQVLALLLLNARQLVPARSLSVELWDDDPPRSASTTIQTYILHLRKFFAKSFSVSAAYVAKEILVTGSGGYTFQASPGAIDVDEFRRLSTSAQTALREKDDKEAVCMFRQALDVWQGSVLLNVEHGRLLEAEVRRLEQCRLDTTELCIEAELRLGRHRETLSELMYLVSRNRFHEELHAQLMLALYRSGRRTGALEAFHTLRRSLIEEYGIEPCPRLQKLHQAVLASDPHLEGPPWSAPATYEI